MAGGVPHVDHRLATCVVREYGSGRFVDVPNVSNVPNVPNVPSGADVATPGPFGTFGTLGTLPRLGTFDRHMTVGPVQNPPPPFLTQVIWDRIPEHVSLTYTILVDDMSKRWDQVPDFSPHTY